MTRKLSAVQTSAGEGKRSRPLNLYSPTSMYPKGLMRIMGNSVAGLQLEQFKQGGIDEVYMISKGYENRQPLIDKFGYGNSSFRIIHNDPLTDYTNNGSGEAIMTNLQRYELTGDSIVLSNDNVFEYDTDSIVEQHREADAVLSILTLHMRPEDTIKNYGLIKADAHRTIEQLVEKPKSMQELMDTLGLSNTDDLMSVPANTAGYILNNDALREIFKDSELNKLKSRSGGFDMASDLIPELLSRGHKIQMIPIDNWGDLGTTDYFLDTFVSALNGNFPTITSILATQGYTHLDKEQNVWVHETSLDMKVGGKKLDQRIADVDLRIGPNTFIGPYVNLGNDSNIRYSNVEGNSRIGNGATVDHAFLGLATQIGDHAKIRASAFTGGNLVNSNKENATKIHGRSVIGCDVTIPEGTVLDRVTIMPGYQFNGERVYSNKILNPEKRDLIRSVLSYRL